MTAVLIGLAAVAVILIVVLISSVRIVNEFERGVIFRLGRVIGAKGPGLFFIVPLVDKMVKVNLQTVTLEPLCKSGPAIAVSRACSSADGIAKDRQPAIAFPIFTDATFNTVGYPRYIKTKPP